MFSIDGLITGLDTTTIIEGLLSIQQRQIDQLSGRQQDILGRQTAFQGIEARMLTLQGQLSSLIRIQDSVFEAKTASVSHENLVAAAASDSAVPGLYSFRVNSLARTHQIATQGLANPDSLITQGTLDIQLGDGPARTITIDATNNTLQGLADAINNSSADVVASVINDGSSGAGHRLLLTGEKTGAANVITVVNNLAPDNSGAVKLVFSGGGPSPSSIAAAVTGANYGAAATPISNAGTGNYTGPDDDTYTFTFEQSGQFGERNIRIAYTDGSGDNSGTFTYRRTDAGSFKNVAEGLQIKFDAGGVAVEGQTFTIDVSSADGGVADAVPGPNYQADVPVGANEGVGNYTGPDDDTYTFTFLDSDVVGREDVRLAYTDGSGDNSGTITIDRNDAGNLINVAEGLQIQLDPGFAVAGDTFTIDVSTSDGNVAAPQLGQGFGSDSPPVANAGSGTYNGVDDDVYSFTVVQGGVAGEDTLQIDYQDGSGDNIGTVTYNPADVGSYVDVAEGLRIQFESGLLVAGDTFTAGVTAAVAGSGDSVQDPADASITIGSGAGAITVVNDTNQIDDVIPGVTLDLLAADASQEITLTVAQDVESAKTSIVGFVESFNDLMSYIDDQVRFDTEAEQASALLGNRSVITIQEDVRRAINDLVAGVSTQMNRLSALGINVSDKGHLAINQSKLDDVLAGNVDGVTLTDVRRLFALDGQSDNGNIDFVLGSTRTKESATPYEVDVTLAAERAQITAANALAANVVIDGSNDAFSITVDGKSSSALALNHGTYTRQELATHLAATINTDPEFVGRSVSVSLQNDFIQITSDAYGSTSEVRVGSGSALADLGFAGTENDRGQDVAGSFYVNGVEESAHGSGRLLVGDAENENTADLQVLVSLTPSQVLPAPEANLTVTRGLAARLDQVLSTLLDSTDGRVNTVNEGFEDEVESIQASIDRLNEQFEARQESLIQQFLALETAVSGLQSTSNFLVSQLASVSSLSIGT